MASPATSQEEQTTSHRKLTFIYYLNKHCDGGQLRLYHNSNDLRPMLNLMQGNYSGINYDNENSFTDIEPAIDRLIVFRRFVC